MRRKTLGTSLTAAGVVFNIDDFRDPQLDQLTPIQVTKDGRVFGHLAGWKTNHIGYPGQSVKPPKSATGYKYFHQGVVPTNEGDLPVGHLTLGTGHAGQGDAMAAAAHYDNTGSQVAAVRAGEDKHGIWISGRTLPHADDLQRQTLRRSSLSGDWRRIADPDTGRTSMELVAALAVNVPGFPIPRTEQLVASGGEQTMLVAAGIVRNGPITRAEVESMVAAAAVQAQQTVEREFRRREIVASAAPLLEQITADARNRRRRELTAAANRLRRDQLQREFLSIVASGASTVNDVTGHMPGQLHRYWTAGKGLARWAPTPTPYRSLVTALRSEIPDMRDDQIKGLAANLYHDVFHEWPGRKSKGGGKLAASVEPPTPDEAQQLLAEMSDELAALPIPGTVDEPIEAAADEVDEVDDLEPSGTPSREQIADAVRAAVVQALETVGEAIGVKLVADDEPDGDEQLTGEFTGQEIEAAAKDRRAQTAEGAKKYGVSIGDVIGGKVDEAVEVVDETAKAAQRDVSNIAAKVGEAIFGKKSDTPAAHDETGVARDKASAKPNENKTKAPAVAPGTPAAPATESRPAANEALAVQPAIPADAPAPRKDMGAGTDHPMEEDESPDSGAFGGKLVEYNGDTGEATYSDGSITDGKSWRMNDGPVDAPPPPPATSAQAEAEKNGDVVNPTIGRENMPDARKDVGAGTDHPMLEDEAPDAGADGGKLVEFNGDGTAVYDDGTMTDGKTWTRMPVLPDMGYDGQTMLEDQAPHKGAHGGALVEYDGDAGVARYDDGTETDGKAWRKTPGAKL